MKLCFNKNLQKKKKKMVCFWQVHFLGWGDRWDQVFQRTSEDLQKLHTFTSHWRQVSNRSEAEFKKDSLFLSNVDSVFSSLVVLYFFLFFFCVSSTLHPRTDIRCIVSIDPRAIGHTKSIERSLSQWVKFPSS